MLDTDTILMKRALDLARRGAGLVSPNPMVGAVLVKDGRVVGEGYHRYDRLKHAESYAIEAAGELARGATLYCSLEPCCHHGRTSPCTDALIEAKIARGVIAIKDPDVRVAGRGIDQLRRAGIEVEVGLLEDRALKINESYFKFITTGTPFVHGVIEYPADPSECLNYWTPSNEFLRVTKEYDGVMIGSRPELNKLVVDEALRRERHRKLVVAASTSEPSLIDALQKRIKGEVSIVTVETEPGAGATGKVLRLEEGVAHGAPRSLFGSLLATLTRLQVTSVLILPGIFDSSDPENFEEFDKITLAIPGSTHEQGFATRWAFGDIEFDVEDVSVTESGSFTELTGYPSLSGVA
ncbi:MAG TPA: bifunctional diaminohydroxyphosphoribosylaminopyrimidine deaminase/5-amino-6-(5-phosphoribosylamino)uracil reductase RibD [Blastocatellia bacterium]|nr:bifunctional diaminohydroxyphosphoribosylaminopyrimidine deaminase/5-amino-6-(5-phosphoribosylamino)uracil reductase RibD [Blastocatellia bacterium]